MSDAPDSSANEQLDEFGFPINPRYLQYEKDFYAAKLAEREERWHKLMQYADLSHSS